MNPCDSPYQFLKYVAAEGVATVTLHRPQVLNSFNAEMLAEFADALERIRQNDAQRCVLLTGSGRGFSAGQDLNERFKMDPKTVPDLAASLEQKYNPIIKAITDLPKPVVCAVNGVAAGAGANIALACDIVLAARSASFVQAFSSVGLIPDAGGTWHLPRLIGRARSMGLTMLGEKLSAAGAYDWGLIWQVVEDTELMHVARELADKLARRPTLALGLIKRAMNASASNTLIEQLDLERDLQGLAGRSRDYREGVNAFMEKRNPKFQGR